MAAAANPLETFIWGAGGAKKTPEQVAREREIAAAIMGRAGDTSPVGHWTQGAARVVDTLGGVFRENRANAAEEEGMARGQSAFDPIVQALMGGGGASTGQASFAGAAPASVPQTADAQAIRQGLISRGLPEHVADGFLMNMQDESGLNPGINEAQPLVPGSRGGYGLYQLTGPRRVAYEQYAQQLGVDPSNVDAQLDFLMSELQGPEAAAAQSILSAPDAGSAAAAIATNFLRPSKQHLDRRVASYTAGGGNLSAQPAQPVQVASLDPSIGMPAQLPEIGPSGGPQLSPAAAPQAPAQEIAQALMAPPQGGVAPQQANSLLPLLLQASGDPWARKQYGGIIDALMGQQMQQMDPQYQMGLEKSRLELEAMRNPGPSKPVWQGDRWWDISGGQPTPLTDAAVEPGYRQLSPEEVAQAGLDRQKGWQVAPTGEIKQIGGGGVNVSVGGDGSPGLGKLSTDYGYVSDPETGQPVIDPATGLPTAAAIPGSPAAIAAQQAAEAASSQQGAGLTSNVDKATTTLATTKSVLDLIDNSDQPTTGTLSRPFAMYSGSPAGKVRSYVATLQSGVALGAMQALKEASATGATGFGALSEKELSLLISDIGALDPDNTEPEIFRETVQRIEDRSKRVIADIKKNVSPERIQELGLQSLLDQFSGGSGSEIDFDYTASEPPPGWGGDAGLWRFMSPEDRALW